MTYPPPPAEGNDPSANGPVPPSGQNPPPPGGTPPPPPPPPPPPGAPRPAAGGFDIGAAFGWGWKKFTENPVTYIVAILVIAVIGIVLSLVANLIIFAIFGGGGAEPVTLNPETGEITGGGVARGFFATFALQMLASFVGSIVTYLLASGVIKAALSTADGHKPSIGEALTPHDPGRTLLLALLLSLGTSIGLILCYIPGIIFAFLTMFSLYFLIDEGREPIDAIKQSISLVTSNLGPVLLFWLACVAAVIVGAIVCGVGLLVAIPVVLLATVFVFRSLVHRPIAA